MYVVSLKFDAKKILVAVTALCIVIAVICVSFPGDANDVLTDNVDKTVKNTSDHIDFLKLYGYNISDKPVQIQEIIIPQKFSADYEKYNDLQKLSGFDLSDYMGRRVKKYTYKVSDYPDSSDEVVANIFVYKNKVIGGDISSTAFGGFVHGFIKE